MLGKSRIAVFFHWFVIPDVRKISSQNVQNTSGSEQFLKFRCRKMARGCGAKHIFKSKSTKHHVRGPIFEVPMSKNSTRLWREAHFQVKIYKARQVRSNFWSFDVGKWYAAVARSAFASQNLKKSRVWPTFWSSDVEKKFVSWKVSQSINESVCQWVS